MSTDGGLLKRRIQGLCFISSSVVALLTLFLKLNLLNDFENRSWDLRLRSLARHISADPNIKIIVIDQNSLDYFAREEKVFWQWPRGMYEPVVKYLQKAKAKGVAFDILFTEPSSYSVEDDRDFGNSLMGDMPVVIPVSLRNKRKDDSNIENSPIISRLRSDNSETFLAEIENRSGVTFRSYPQVTAPIDELIQSASAFANVTNPSDEDGIFRHIELAGKLGSELVLSLPFSLFNATGGKLLPDLSHRLQPGGQLAITFSGKTGSYKTYSIDSIITSYRSLLDGAPPSVGLDDFKDSYVFIGMTAPGLLDLRPTPLAKDLPGVEFNAAVLDNILHDRFVRTVSFTTSLTIGITLILFVTMGCIFFRRFSQQILVACGVLILFILGCWQAALHYYWMPFVSPFLALVLAILCSIAFQYHLEGRQYRFIKNAFRHYVSATVIEEIISDPSSLSLGGARRELTIFFSDIAGFTTLSEKIEASKLASLLNIFLSEMTDIILESGGTIDKYVGDAIVAFWNAPLEILNHAERGVLASLICQKRLTELQERFITEFDTKVEMRVGVNTGIVSVGNFGSNNRFNYTVIGDSANLASRLEQVNKFFGTKILISQQTLKSAGSDRFKYRKIGDLRVVGKTEAISVFEPWMDVAPIDTSELERYNLALQLFEAGEIKKANDLFELLPNDTVSRAYVTRIKNERILEKKPDGWSSIWALTEKS